jgi:hypothetical protein
MHEADPHGALPEEQRPCSSSRTFCQVILEVNFYFKSSKVTFLTTIINAADRKRIDVRARNLCFAEHASSLCNNDDDQRVT